MNSNCQSYSFIVLKIFVSRILSIQLRRKEGVGCFYTWRCLKAFSVIVSCPSSILFLKDYKKNILHLVSLSCLAKIQHDTSIKGFQIIISLWGETLGAHLC